MKTILTEQQLANIIRNCVKRALKEETLGKTNAEAQKWLEDETWTHKGSNIMERLATVSNMCSEKCGELNEQFDINVSDGAPALLTIHSEGQRENRFKLRTFTLYNNVWGDRGNFHAEHYRGFELHFTIQPKIVKNNRGIVYRDFIYEQIDAAVDALKGIINELEFRQNFTLIRGDKNTLEFTNFDIRNYLISPDKLMAGKSISGVLTFIDKNESVCDNETLFRAIRKKGGKGAGKEHKYSFERIGNQDDTERLKDEPFSIDDDTDLSIFDL